MLERRSPTNVDRRPLVQSPSGVAQGAAAKRAAVAAGAPLRLIERQTSIRGAASSSIKRIRTVTVALHRRSKRAPDGKPDSDASTDVLETRAPYTYPTRFTLALRPELIAANRTACECRRFSTPAFPVPRQALQNSRPLYTSSSASLEPCIREVSAANRTTCENQRSKEPVFHVLRRALQNSRPLCTSSSRFT